MDQTESEDTSNDTTMISELLKSAEVMPSQSQLIADPSMTTTTTSVGGLGKDVMRHHQHHHHMMSTTNTSSEQHPIDIPPLAAIGSSGPAANMMILNQGFASHVTDNSNKVHHRHVHIPYILNGELYQIQTQDGENVTVKCCHCPPDRVYRGSVRSTGNFHMHIKRRHPDLLEKLHDMKVNALLERRDRLMRNRKFSTRNNRNRLSSGSIVASTPISKVDSKLNMGTLTESTTLSVNSPPELSLLHTHKLKIKTVFQRHQMQQKEAAEMRNWNNSEYVVMPIAKLTSTSEDTDGPINYSLKTQEKTETMHSSISPQQTASQQPQVLQSHLQQDKPNVILTNTNDCNNISSSEQQVVAATAFRNNNEYIYENRQNDVSRELSTTTNSQSSISPSVMSSFSSVNNNDPFNTELSSTYQQQHNPQPLHQQQTLSVVKPEELLTPNCSEQQAIDLTLHTDSGIYSNSNGSLLNNMTQNGTKERRAGSHQTITTTPAQTAVGGGGVTTAESSPQKWQELLMHVENSLRDIQHEMNIRNQIESNRMFLDIAKFKFLHPGFQFNW